MGQLQDMSQDINRRFLAATTKYNRISFGKRQANKLDSSKNVSYKSNKQQITDGDSISQICKENSVISEITNPNTQGQIHEIINKCKSKLDKRNNRVNQRNMIQE